MHFLDFLASREMWGIIRRVCNPWVKFTVFTKSCQKSFMKVIVFCLEILINLSLAQIEDKRIGQNRGKIDRDQ